MSFSGYSHPERSFDSRQVGNQDPRAFIPADQNISDGPGTSAASTGPDPILELAPGTAPIWDPAFELATSSTLPQRSTRKYADKVGWERFRQEICDLYRTKTLKEVVIIMERDYNFVATEKMYKDRFREWGFRK
ncbi:Clr5 domain-containing protein, partial [Diaporthe sp. PMI_573]